MKGLLVLEDGSVWHGEAVGHSGTAFGEIVFNTSMTGYQEVLTDPSYAGQIVVMTAAHIGNYGVRDEESESGKVHAAGFIARDFPGRWSGTGGEQSLGDYLARSGVTGLHGLDTRALVRRIRTEGAMRAGLSTLIEDPEELHRLVLASPPMIGSDLALSVSPSETSEFPAEDEELHVAAIDYGMKRNIVRLLNANRCRVTVFPASATSDQILAADPDGIFLSNGPGDPAALAGPIRTIEKLVPRRPIFGICLGHQLLGHALGGRTFKLKFGHRGANHPVSDLRTGAVSITSQNHGFSVDEAHLPADVVATHRNLNDGTLEGFRHRTLPILAAQFHPEAAPGPHESHGLFREFVRSMRARAEEEPARSGGSAAHPEAPRRARGGREASASGARPPDGG
ncbi:MAG: glutamine-hydrolyzing carbamoyl-phosphate synthase small subunit [Acidobacteriota bacterium]